MAATKCKIILTVAMKACGN